MTNSTNVVFYRRKKDDFNQFVVEQTDGQGSVVRYET